MNVARIRASDLAKFTGHNTFVTPHEVRTLFWQRNAKLAARFGIAVEEEVDELERCVRACSADERAAVARSVALPDDADAATVARAVERTLVEPMAVAPTTTAATTQLEAMAPPLQALRAPIEREAQKLRGVRRETASIDRLEQETGRRVGKRNTQFYRKKLPLARQDVVVELVGMLDGRFEDTGELVEIKERRNRLFGRVVAYERVQLHCYMFLTDTRRATLLERFDDEVGRYEVDFDEAFWNEECLARVEAFMDAELPA